MDKLPVSANTVYQSTRDVNVINNFSQETSSFLSWLQAVGCCINQSMIALNASLQIIYMNNAWGTFDPERSPKNLDDILANIEHLYYNSGIVKSAIAATLQYIEPRNIVLHMVDGVDVFGRSYPVLERGKVVGVILTAWKHSNNTKPRETLTYTIKA